MDVTLWGRTAEIAGEYLAKGKSVLIEGRLQLDTWDDKESGQKRSKLRVVGENMTMLGGKSDSPSSQPHERTQAPQSEPEYAADGSEVPF